MTTPFWQTNNPVAAYIVAFQKFVGIPQTGVWDTTSHAVLYKLANKFNPNVNPSVAWGAEPVKTVEHVLSLVQDATEPDSFAAVRAFLGNLGYPLMSFEDAQKWVENLSEEEAKAVEDALKAVAEAVGQAESGPASVPAAANAPADQQPVDNGVPPVENGTPPITNGTPPITNGAPPIVNGGPIPSNGTPSNGGPAVSNGGRLPVVVVKAGMKTGTKVAIGLGVAAGALLIGWLAYKAYKKPEGGPPMGGCNCG